jgi:UDP-glucose 4-epimerase
MNSVLITGGLGLIGSSLAIRLFANGYDVFIVDNLDERAGGSECNVHDGLRERTIFTSIDDPDIWRRLPSGLNTVVNLSGLSGHAYSMAEPVADLRDNITTQAAFLQRMCNQGGIRKVILASTRQIYGSNPKDPAGPPAPADVNAVSRLAVEHLHEVLLRGTPASTSVLRLSNVYGAAMLNAGKPQGVLGTWLQAAAAGEDLVVTHPSPTRDVLHVEDLTDLLVLMIDSEPTDTQTIQHFDVGGGSGIPLQRIARHLAEVSGVRVIDKTVSSESARFAVGHYATNIDIAASTFGWTPQRDWRTEMTRIVRDAHMIRRLEES